MANNFGIQPNPNKPNIETTPQVNQATTNNVTDAQTEEFVNTGTTSASIDTTSSFWGDVLEMGAGVIGGGASVSPMSAPSGSMPSGSAPSPFSASSGNIAQILQMFSPYRR